jgi:hypothetical protein
MIYFQIWLVVQVQPIAENPNVSRHYDETFKIKLLKVETLKV